MLQSTDLNAKMLIIVGILKMYKQDNFTGGGGGGIKTTRRQNTFFETTRRQIVRQLIDTFVQS